MTTDRSDHAACSRRAARTRKKRLGILLGSLFAVALCAGIRYYWGAAPAQADPADSPASRGDSESNSPADQASPAVRRSAAASGTWRPGNSQAFLSTQRAGCPKRALHA